MAQDLALPENLPTGLYELAASATDTGTATSAFQKATLIERYLRRYFTNDPKSSAGAAIGGIQQFLTSQTGTTVQFAEAFTLAARILRLPAGWWSASRAARVKEQATLTVSRAVMSWSGRK